MSTNHAALALCALAALPMSAMAAKATSDQCNNLAITVMAMASNRDEGVPFADLINEIRRSDLVKGGIAKEYATQDNVRRLMVIEAVKVYHEDRFVSPENIYTNRYVACMGSL